MIEEAQFHLSGPDGAGLRWKLVTLPFALRRPGGVRPFAWLDAATCYFTMRHPGEWGVPLFSEDDLERARAALLLTEDDATELEWARVAFCAGEYELYSEGEGIERDDMPEAVYCLRLKVPVYEKRVEEVEVLETVAAPGPARLQDGLDLLRRIIADGTSRLSRWKEKRGRGRQRQSKSLEPPSQ